MHNGKVLQINPEVKVQKVDAEIRVSGGTNDAVVSKEQDKVHKLETDKIAMRSNLTKVRTNQSVEQAVVGIEKPGVQVKDVDKIVLRTSYRGPQGPKGDTSTFNDLEIPSLAARFTNRLT